MPAPLLKKICRLIEATGPMTLAEYMHICMADPEHGYYRRKQVFGSKGDFVTAPEISQMFGEMIGIWCLEAWKQIGKPTPFNLVEFGPGRGALMDDLLRATRINGEFSQAVSVWLVETSNRLRKEQSERLGSHDIPINWIDDLTDLPASPTVLIGNEFLDVLPIYQYVKQAGKWHQRMVGLEAPDRLGFFLGPGEPDISRLPEGAAAEPDGAVFECSPAREAQIRVVCEHLRNHSGAALFIDYGHEHTGFGDTFQAVKNHEYAEVLKQPGEMDLTSHVDFETLAAVATEEGCHVLPLMAQGEFLLKLGLLERAGRLGASQSQTVRERLTREAERLALPHEMGDLFKCLCITSDTIEIFPFAKHD